MSERRTSFLEDRMSSRGLMCVAMAVATGLVGACGQTVMIHPPRTHALAAMGEQTDRRLGDLRFMAGTWGMFDKDHYSEEFWSAPSGTCMMGAFRIVQPDGAVALYELISIAAESGGVFMRLRHFDDKLMPWKTEAAGPILLRLERTANLDGAAATSRDPRTGETHTYEHEAVFRRVSGSESLDAITYRLKNGALWSEVSFTPESKREALRFEMRRVR